MNADPKPKAKSKKTEAEDRRPPSRRRKHGAAAAAATDHSGRAEAASPRRTGQKPAPKTSQAAADADHADADLADEMTEAGATPSLDTLPRRAERNASLGPAEPIPLTVLTGFLGAGKTSLLNRLITDPALADTAVIINEFGEIGLDHLLVKPINDDMVLLQSGCLCCTLRGDLVDALEQLLRDLDNGRVAFRRVMLETTGLADPAPVLQTAMAHPYLVMRYRLDGVITVVDAVNGARDARRSTWRRSSRSRSPTASC